MAKLKKAPYCNVFLRRGMNEETLKCVLTHEVVVLAAIHGEDAIRVADKQPDLWKMVDPDSEYDRLETLYGAPKESNTSYVSAVYGMKIGKLFQKTVGQKIEDFISKVVDEDDDEEDEEPAKPAVPARPVATVNQPSKKACMAFLKAHSVPDVNKDMSADDTREFTMVTALQLAGALEMTVDADAELADLMAAIAEETGNS